MTFDPLVLALLLGISTLANAIVAAIVSPFFEKYSLDNFWIMYISWVVAGALVFLANVNLFAGVFENQIVGLIVTAIIAGRASNILHDLTDRPAEVWTSLEGENEETYSLDEVKESVDEANG